MQIVSFLSLVSAIVAQHTALDVVLNSKDHTTLATLAAKIPAVLDVLKSAGPLTLFAPNDAAFKKLDKATVDAVTTDKALLAKVLTYHVIPGAAFDPKTAEATSFPKTAAGLPVAVSVVEKSGVTVAFGLGSSKVVGSVTASNGVVHVVDTVLIPLPSASKTAVDAKLTQLVASLQKVKLVEAVDGAKDVTIFAPTDKAFENLVAFAKENKLEITDDLLAAVLKLHVVPGVVYSTDIVKAKTALTVPALSKENVTVQLKDGSVLVKGEGNTAAAKVVIADVLYNNGVIHVVDTVLLPKLNAKTTGTASSNTTGTASSNTTSGAASYGIMSLFSLFVFVL
jgi:transforming growth factor-beta-induced protein